MASELLERTAALRDEALEAVKASKPYAVFKALDEATVLAGGVSSLANPAPASRAARSRKRKATAPNRAAGDASRVPHGDAADEALSESGEPLHIVALMEAAKAKGAKIGGDNPVNNFRSTLSKDDRFRSVQHNNAFFWWYKDRPLPQNWSEATDPDLLAESAASSFNSNQRGGDGHDPATTTLARL